MDTFESTAGVVYTAPKVFGTFKEPIILVSRRLSPYYINNRRIPSYPEKQDVIISNFVTALGEADLPEGYKITTTEAAGILFASPVGDRLKRPVSYVKKKAKGHGLGNLIEGDVGKGNYIVGVDDLVTTAISAMRTVNAVREVKAIIEKYFAIFDRNEGGREDLAENGVELVPLVWMGDRFVEFGKEEKYLNSKQVALLGAYVPDPLAWSRNYLQEHPEYVKKKLQASVSEGKLKETAILEVLRDTHPELKEGFKTRLLDWADELGVKHDVDVFLYD